MKELQQEFLERLEQKYGKWDKATSNFGIHSLGMIASDLSISASQLTKLLSGTATEGMYARSIDNVERLIRFEQAQQELTQTKIAQERLEHRVQSLLTRTRNFTARTALFSVLALVAGGVSVFLYFRYFQVGETLSFIEEKHPLAAFFDREFDADFQSPYLKESDVQDYCPCSAFEGEWSLAESYKLPLPGNKRPGIYYLAKSADVRMKCSKSDTLIAGKGRVLLAYEYLINEIWLDKEMVPLSPTYFDKTTKAFTPAFHELDFEENPNFERVATIHSFFINRFEIYDDSIVRRGEPCGRFATDVDERLVSEYAIDLKHILEDVLSDLSQTNCSSTPNDFCDPNLLKEGQSVISFDCLYTIRTENLGFGGGYPYRKGYKLEKQNYSDNLTCFCGE